MKNGKRHLYNSYKNEDMLLFFVPISLLCLICKNGIIAFIFCWLIYLFLCICNNIELANDPYIQELRKQDKINQAKTYKLVDNNSTNLKTTTGKNNAAQLRELKVNNNSTNLKETTVWIKAAQLRELKELYDEGILTKAEFDSEKKKLLK